MPVTAYLHFTDSAPAYGGSFTEGIVGAPKYINPLLAQANDTDRDITALIFSGLTKFDENGELVMDLAKTYDVSDDGLTYTFTLRDNIFWHDNEPITADDVVFTILTAQNENYNSLHIINWKGVEVSKIDSRTIAFKLKNQYAHFLNNTTLGIIPKHLWENVKPVNFGLSDLNTKPIGSGPYKFEKLKKDEFGNIKEYELRAFKEYHDEGPFIKTIIFKFYMSEEDMLDAKNNGDINSLSVSSQGLKKIKFKQRATINKIKLPRYFSVFFNQNQSSALSDKNVRLALNYATNKQELTNEILGGNAEIVNSPILSNLLGLKSPSISYSYDKNKAISLLEEKDWLLQSPENSEGTSKDEGELSPFRFKGEEEDIEELRIELTTSDWPELLNIATEIKKQWEEIGVGVDLQVLPLPELQQVIKERQYEALLFGEVLNINIDPFSFWHSSEKKDPGLNLSLYDNKSADQLLENARQTVSFDERMRVYEEFQDILIEDAPAVFLYSPDYLYVQPDKIKNNNTKIISVPSERFGNINKWYINTKRVFK
ncbi:MAG: hypothetical protein COV29_02365 [Candidatus Yanofskybacteria bacterium CG10_big_fil_rev_8_21_14_0_10_36_16]|uniref:Solute-binding protein family 5 domain-containing protein n=1 Tax=Candidatus Yanofskybacteria bacterium CG10_big_fil_rev_8_21_14_0_10_36_16 TaxID=1975096 RepID=A0A2J0Q810_9BACT|nr:MAG: hypothetical protein COV29_02365 [Candidatus Yanofskybacteria bacterium CG10_big_fil_rev_8_21_14_0_10_36_16]